VLIGIIYVAIAYLMENHYRTSQEQEELIEEDLVHLKQSLTDSIQHLDGVSDIIQRTLSSLYELNTQLSDINSKLEENNTDLKGKIAQFKEIVLALEKNKEELLSSTAILKNKLDTAYAKIHKHEEEMSVGAQSILESDRSLGATCSGFKTSLDRFDEFTREQQASIVEYERLSTKLKEKIAEYEKALSKLYASHPTAPSITDYEQYVLSHDHNLQREADLSIAEGNLLCDRLEQELAKRTIANHPMYDFDDDQTERRRTYSCSW
jgi:DNA repair exonuclease SbcCD ATPase subunit